MQYTHKESERRKQRLLLIWQWVNSSLCYLIQSDLSPVTSYSRDLNAICSKHVDPFSIRHLGKEDGNNKERISANSDSHWLTEPTIWVYQQECLTKHVAYSGLMILTIPDDLQFPHEASTLMENKMHTKTYKKCTKAQPNSLAMWMKAIKELLYSVLFFSVAKSSGEVKLYNVTQFIVQ